ncbi:hypothetical protein D5S17_17360 [Pseudonocardiaceae bacterium YIM PH 21723]|nr:hypothetical protein D5S17_17360 [Pseudonocardiaceae bacterium YIM PH 21723]
MSSYTWKQAARRTERSVRSPLRWLRRAQRENGPERGVLLQAAKAALAAVLSWLAAAELFQLAQPYLAPWAAIFIVEATVFRSVRSAGQQVAAATTAVLLATVVESIVPWQMLGIAVVVFAGLLIGQSRLFGDSGPWVGITALLLITWGTVTQSPLLVDRLIETVLGAGIGLLVNTLVFPPTYELKARKANERLAADMAALIQEMADVMRGDAPLQRTENWSTQVTATAALVTAAEQATSLRQESRRLNLRRSTVSISPPDDRNRSVATTLRDAWPHMVELSQVVRTSAGRTGPFTSPDTPSLQLTAVLLDRLAAVVRSLGRSGITPAELDFAARQASEALADMNDRLQDTQSFGLAGMVLPARHALRELSPTM